MSLTKAQQANREGRITASFAPYLMAANHEKMLNEWRRIVGDPNYQPEDLSFSWPVQFGVYIETFAIDWHQRKTGQPLVMRGASVTHPDKPYIAATLDCFRESDRTVIDCKAPGAFRKLDDVISFYPSQLVVQRECVKADSQALLIVHGGAEPVEHPIPITSEYIGSVWERVDWFWHCVETLTPPAAISAAAPLIPHDAMREISMEGNNSWSYSASDWIANRAAAKEFERAAKEIKALVPDDVRKATGYGIVVSRSKNHSLTIKAEK